MIAHHLGELMAEFDTNLHGWHLKGNNNWIADAISRKNELTNELLTLYLHKQMQLCGQILSANFVLLDISSMTTAWI